MANYCTAAELRTQIDKTGTSGSSSDTALGVIIAAASRAIDQWCNRKDEFIGGTAAAREFAGSGLPYQWIDDAAAITLVAVKDSPEDTAYVSWAATDWIAFTGDPKAPDFNRLPYTGIMVTAYGDYSSFMSGRYNTRAGFRPAIDISRSVPTVQITAQWGYALTSAPASIKQATIALASRWMKQGQSAWSDGLVSVEMGMLLYNRENRDIVMMLERFTKPAIGVR